MSSAGGDLRGFPDRPAAQPCSYEAATVHCCRPQPCHLGRQPTQAVTPRPQPTLAVPFKALAAPSHAV